MKIRIINGSYGLHDGRRVVTMTARSGPFEVEDAEGAALIRAGVAASAESGERSSEMSAAPVARVLENSCQSQEEVALGATGSSGAAGGAPAAAGDIVTPAADRQSEVGSRESEANSEPDQTADYLTLSAAQLRELCDGRGITYKKNAAAKALRSALEQYDAEARTIADSLNQAVSDATGVPLDVLEAADGISPAKLFPEMYAADPVDAEGGNN